MTTSDASTVGAASPGDCAWSSSTSVSSGMSSVSENGNVSSTDSSISPRLVPALFFLSRARIGYHRRTWHSATGKFE